MINMEDMKALLKDENVKITDEKGQITVDFIERLKAIDKPQEEKSKEDIEAEIEAKWADRYRDAFFNGAKENTENTKAEGKSYFSPISKGSFDDPYPSIDELFKSVTKKE